MSSVTRNSILALGINNLVTYVISITSTNQIELDIVNGNMWIKKSIYMPTQEMYCISLRMNYLHVSYLIYMYLDQ